VKRRGRRGPGPEIRLADGISGEAAESNDAIMQGATLHPVILAVPRRVRNLQPAERARFLSRHARKALQISAEISRLRVGRLEKDGRGRPRPSNGVYWSLTHKDAFVGAVAADVVVGIDIERITPRKSDRLFQKVAGKAEWALSQATDWRLFHRYWTAKEAVLKAAGTGLTDLSECRVIEIIDENSLRLKHRGNVLPVEHYYFEDHLASIVRCKPEIEWTLLYEIPGSANG